MLILAIETSGSIGSVALLGDDQSWSQHLTAANRTAQDLAPTIRSLLAAAQATPREVDGIAVSSGPGSFTGLRVGVMTAKTLAYALGKPCVGVNTLDVNASQVEPQALPEGQRLWAILDAQRRQVFAASYQLQTQKWMPLQPTSVVDQSAWLAELRPGDLVTGSGVASLLTKLTNLQGMVLVDEGKWRPEAIAVARLARPILGSGQAAATWNLSPQYFRLSAAEEKARKGPAAV